MSFFYVDPNDNTSSSLGKGLMAGGVLAAGTYGLTELRDWLSEKLEREHFPDYVYFEKNKKLDEEDAKEHEKRSSYLDEFGNKYLYGLGTVGGAYGTYKLLNYISDRYNKEAIRGDLRKLESVLEENIKRDLKIRNKPKEKEEDFQVYFSQDDDNANQIKQASFDQKIEMSKMAADPTIRGFLEGLTYYMEKTASDEVPAPGLLDSITGGLSTLGDAGKFLLYDVPFDYAPIGYGIGSGLGLIGGWKLGETVFNPYYEDKYIEGAPLKDGTDLLYSFKREKDEEDGEDK